MTKTNLYPTFTSLPGRYAKALFEVGKQHNILDELLKNFQMFNKFILSNKSYKNLLTCTDISQLLRCWRFQHHVLQTRQLRCQSLRDRLQGSQVPRTRRFQRQRKITQIWMNIFKYLNFHDVFISFIDVLLTSRRFGIIKNIENIFHKAVMIDRKIREVTVYSVININEKQKQKLLQLITNMFREQIDVSDADTRDVKRKASEPERIDSLGAESAGLDAKGADPKGFDISYSIKRDLLTGIQICSDGLVYNISGAETIRQLAMYCRNLEMDII